MTSQYGSSLHGYLSDVSLATLVAQMLQQRGISPDDAKHHPDVVADCVTLLADQGIHTPGHTRALMNSLVALHLYPENVKTATTLIAETLWAILGDPESGPPPEIYKRAAFAVHTFFIAMFDLEAATRQEN